MSADGKVLSIFAMSHDGRSHVLYDRTHRRDLPGPSEEEWRRLPRDAPYAPARVETPSGLYTYDSNDLADIARVLALVEADIGPGFDTNELRELLGKCDPGQLVRLVAE